MMALRFAALLCSVALLPSGASAAGDPDVFPGYGAAATAPLKKQKGCGYEEWTVTATKNAGNPEGPFTRGDEFVAKQVPCEEVPAKTTATKNLIAALKKANTPMPKDARIVQVGQIESSVKEDDKRVSYRQATLRIFSKEMELSLGRCEDPNPNVLCGAMIVGKCYSPLSTAADRACVAWAIDELAFLLERAAAHRGAGGAKACSKLSEKVASNAKGALGAFEKMRKDFTWKKGLKFKTMKAEVLDENAVAARFKDAAEKAQQVCKAK